jgi:hypothetical protein
MPASFRLPNGDQTVIDGSQILIGTAADCQLKLPGLAPRHAKITEVAGRWLLESLGDWLLKVGDDEPSRKNWLKSGDMIYLSPSGPGIEFRVTSTSPTTTTSAEESASTGPLEETGTEGNEEQPSGVLERMLSPVRYVASAVLSILRPRDESDASDTDAADGR